MSYATLADMVARYGQRELVELTDPERVESIDVDAVERALADAGAEMDGYLAVRYALPIESVPEVLTRLCCDLARYHLYRESVTDLVKQRRDAVIQSLRDIASGRLTLGLPAAAQAAQSAQARAVRVRAAARTFGSLLDRFGRRG